MTSTLAPSCLKGTHDLSWYTKQQIKRVIIVRRAKGYFVQFCIDTVLDQAHNAAINILNKGWNHEASFLD
ncbi:MAG: hypothetical protein F6K36_02320 [Symploca sp. SIO3C6]|uniref:Transposase n=1 Tax=Symploca sp. SIO1C4 TaxID=2607765 RepID=A0A6B3N487_9CYAN|nr:hypothetical protein [Symploca sp. SIO3C6]NER26323.1 hypothetical protein [Symploca sp. SIO1C4]